MKKAIFMLVALLAAGSLHAQKKAPGKSNNLPQSSNSRTVSGMVKDNAGESIPGAVVKLISGKDTLVKYSDLNGAFSYGMVKSPVFRLSVSSLGYQPFSYVYNYNSSIKSIVLPEIELILESVVFPDVVINGNAGVVYKVDTVEYHANSYKTRPEKSLDELLTRMAGMEVDANGSISHNGQSVSKIRLNGKDYVGGNVSQAIQNLPAEVLEKVQVIDDYGDQASRTGIKSGDPNKILNITTSPNYADNNSFAGLIDNRYQNTKEIPLSTFSVDVDNASYSNIRRFINNGQLPPRYSVRIEEMVNYFRYQLPEPKGNGPVSFTTELSVAPWATTHRLLRVALKARSIPANRQSASNLVLLINLSGTMAAGEKLPLVQQTMKMLVEQLGAKDRLSIVTYNSAAKLMLLPTPGDQKEIINNAIDKLVAGGGSATEAGIKLAYKIAKDNFKNDGNNRVILATDGNFVTNAGNQTMEELIAKERETGTDLSILGFGASNYDDDNLETLADKGNGNYAHIDNSTEAYKALVAGFGSTLFTVAKDVKLQIEFNPTKVQAYRLIGYDDRILNKEDFNNDKKDAGDMGSGHTVTALYEIIPAGIKDNFAGNVDDLKYQKPEKRSSTSDEMLTVKFRYKDPKGDVSKMSEAVLKDIPKDFDKQSADFRFAAAVAEAGMLLRDSEYKGNANYDQVIKIATQAKGNDEEGYRSEFVRLIQSVKLLDKAEVAKL